MDRCNSSRWMICGVAAAVVWLAPAVECRAAGTLPDDLTLCLDEAKQANAANDIERERRLLTHAETLQGAPKDAAEVQRRLAVLAWKYHHRFDEARARLVARCRERSRSG